MYMQVFDYVESGLKIVTQLLHLNERSPRDSHWLEFKVGFFDAAFKFQPRQSTTCFSEGYTYFKGTKETLINMVTHESLSGVDEFNFEDQSYTLLRKCNYADTIYGTYINN
jgi:hypothetical protein